MYMPREEENFLKNGKKKRRIKGDKKAWKKESQFANGSLTS